MTSPDPPNPETEQTDREALDQLLPLPEQPDGNLPVLFEDDRYLPVLRSGPSRLLGILRKTRDGFVRGLYALYYSLRWLFSWMYTVGAMIVGLVGGLVLALLPFAGFSLGLQELYRIWDRNPHSYSFTEQIGASIVLLVIVGMSIIGILYVIYWATDGRKGIGPSHKPRESTDNERHHHRMENVDTLPSNDREEERSRFDPIRQERNRSP